MQFKKGQQIITIMKCLIYVCSTQLKYVNSILHVDKCVLFTFAPPIISVIDVPGHDLNSNAFLNLDASLSHSSMNVLYME